MQKLIDMHSHIIPGVDDGAQDMETCMQMLRIAAQDGISKIILTPHNKPGHRPMNSPRVSPKVQELTDRLADEKIDIKLYIGSELYYRSDLAQEIENARALPLAGSRYVLVEFNPSDDYDYIRNGLYSLLMNGYYPILAHVERYRNIRARKSGMSDLAQLGCYFQINAGSVMGKFGFDARQYTRKLIKQKQVHFIATDAHDAKKRAPYLSACADYVAGKYGKEYAGRLFYDNPYHVIAHQEITN